MAILGNFLIADRSYTEALFWSLTPRRVLAHIDVARRRYLRERNMHMETGYYAALVARNQGQVRPLAEYLLSDEPPHQQTPEEKLAVVQQWAAAMAAR